MLLEVTVKELTYVSMVANVDCFQVDRLSQNPLYFLHRMKSIDTVNYLFKSGVSKSIDDR
jgi:hypothetical protein